MTELNELYQSIILDHNRRPRNFGELPDATGVAHGRNPLCGDEVTVWVKLDSAGVISDISFKGVGCAISRAAASMMTASVKGKHLTEATELFEDFQGVVTGKVTPDSVKTKDRSLQVFSGVSRFPVRVKCAVLPWHALRSALNGEHGDSVTSEQHPGSGGEGTTP